MKRLSKILLAAAVVLVMTMGLSAKADAAEWSGLQSVMTVSGTTTRTEA